MRKYLFVFIGLLVINGAFAVGIGVPETLSDEVEMDVGDKETHVFLLRGDSTENDVRFFITADDLGIVWFEGVSEYEKAYNVEPFEEIPIEIELFAIGEGTTTVRWGFRYLNSNSSDLRINQVVSSGFELTVDGNGYVDDTNDDSTSSSGGGGGGGGGAFIDPTQPVKRENKPIDVAELEGNDISIEDISAQGSATSEMVAAPDSARNQVQPTVFGQNANQGLSAGEDASGKTSLLLVTVMFVLTAGLSFASYRAVKGEEDE